MKANRILLHFIAVAALSFAAVSGNAAPVVYQETLADNVPNYSATSTYSSGNINLTTPIDYDQIIEGVDFYQDLYPYTLMSYFAEMYKISSSNPKKQNALDQRLEKLTEAGYERIEDVTFIPEPLRPLFVHEGSSKKVKKSAPILNGFYEADSQFKARLFINLNKKTLALAIAGTDFSSATSIYSAVRLSLGQVSAAAETARNIAAELQEAYPKFTIELTGSSQGGAIAQYAAINPKIKAKAVVFNSLALHPDITRTLSVRQKARIQHAYVEGETLNGDNYHLMGGLQNTMPVTGTIIPVGGELEGILTNTFYSSASTVQYYITTTAGMLHWTGSLLKAVEYHAGYTDFTSLY